MTKHKPTPVVLGMHANDQLNIFVRGEDGGLHQAARIMTHNGVDPAAMTAVMADLSDAFGWREIASAALEVPHPSRELPRLTGVAAAAPVTGALPAADIEVKTPPRIRQSRRTAAEMETQRKTVVRLLSNVTSAQPWTTAVVHENVCKALRLPLSTGETNLRRQLTELHQAGLIGRTSIERANGMAAYFWHRV